MIDLTAVPVLIVGGGAVAARKAASLVEAGATGVRVVALRLTAEFPETVIRTEKAYDAGDIGTARLIFAATDRPDVNAAVVADARGRGIWVNRVDADADAPGDFVTPARFNDDAGVTVTVSASSAALSVVIRDGLAARFDPNWTMMARAMREIRPWVRSARGVPPSRRAAVFRDLASPPAFDCLATGGVDALLAWITERYPDLGAPPPDA